MPHWFCCGQGHRWEAEVSGTSNQATICPSCGGVGEELALKDTVQYEPSLADAPAPQSGGPESGPLPVVPGYEMLEYIGRGGMSVVYKARHLRLKRLVALKMIRGGTAADPEHLARLSREAEAVARLQHPHIVQIHEVGEWRVDGGEAVPFLALEYVEGENLAVQLAKGVWPARPAAALVETLARAIHYAHEQGVVHRDLKPANVLLPLSREPPASALAGGSRLNPELAKVTDFGLAKQLDGDDTQTRTGVIVGTPAYMAPEQARGQSRHVGPAADIYALGAILYEMLTGRPPFKAATALDTLEQVCQRDPVAPRRLQPGLPRDLETITLKCLQKDPRKRYPTALDLADDLRRFQDGKPIQARPVRLHERGWRWCRRNPAVASLLLVLLLVIVSAFAAVTTLWVHAEQQRQVAQEQAASLLLDQGQTVCEKGDVGRGMHLLVRALATAPSGAEDLRTAARASLSCWSAQVHPVRAILMHGERISAAAFSPDGKLVVTGDHDGTLRFWHAANGKPTGLVLKQPDKVLRTLFSPDGRTLVTGSWIAQCRLWDLAAGRLQKTAAGETAHANPLALAPDGRTAAIYHEGARLRLWDLVADRALSPPLDQATYVYSAAFSPHGKLLACGSHEGARVWRLEEDPPDQHKPRLLGTVAQAGAVNAVAFRPDGRVLFTGGSDKTVRAWDTTDLRPLSTPVVHDESLVDLAVHPDGRALVTSTLNGAVWLWDLERHERIGSPLPAGDMAVAVAFSPDGQQVLAASIDGVARLWSVRPRPGPNGTPRHGGPIWALTYSPDGQFLLTAGANDQTARLWDAATGEPVGPVVQTAGGVNTVVFSPDGRTFLTAGSGVKDRPACLWDTTTAAAVGQPLNHPGQVFAAAFSPNGTVIATGCQDRKVRLWDVATGALIRDPLPHPGEVRAVAFRPDGSLLATGCDSRTLRLWDIATGESVGPSFEPDSAVLAGVFSPDGRYLLTGNAGKHARLWDVQTGKPFGLPLPHQDVVLGVAFSPDGTRIATASGDRTARLWDMATRKPLGPPMWHQGPVRTVAFSPDGKTVASAGVDGVVRFLAVPPPLEGTAEEITLRLEVLTGQTLDENGTTRELDAAAWRQRREQLGAERTGSPQ